jgi:signal transduction histidine kinase
MLKKANELSSDIHALSHQLHSSRLDLVGLVSALAGLCKDISKMHEIEVHFTECDFPFKFPKDVALCLFRVAQEALGNVVKHSQANSATVELGVNASGVSLRIKDHGVGFNVDRSNTGAGIGLIGMQERIRLVGGRLLVRSELRRGTEVVAEVPLYASKDETESRAQTAGR